MSRFHQLVVREMRRQGLSAYGLAKRAGLPLRGVQSFVAGDQDTSTERLARLCEVLDLDLQPKRRRKGGRKRGGR